MSRFYQPDLGGRLAGFAQEYRLRIWQDSLPLLAEYPVGGVGLAAYPATIPLGSRLDLPADSRLAHPDSSWVLLGVEWGPVATLALGLALLAALRREQEAPRGTMARARLWPCRLTGPPCPPAPARALRAATVLLAFALLILPGMAWHGVRSLEMQGYAMAAAAGGVAARELLEEFKADLIICDLQLADSDGLTIIAELRRLTPQVQVMLLTGVNFNPAEVDITFGGLVSTYLPKPARLSAIAAAVARLIGPGAP